MEVSNKGLYNFLQNVFWLSLLVAIISGYAAYHFLLGSGFFGGIEIDTSFWGGLSLGTFLASVVIALASMVKGMSLYH